MLRVDNAPDNKTPCRYLLAVVGPHDHPLWLGQWRPAGIPIQAPAGNGQQPPAQHALARGAPRGDELRGA